METKDSVLNPYFPKGWGMALAFRWLCLGRKAKRNVTLVLQILLCSQKTNLVYGAPLSNSSSNSDGYLWGNYMPITLYNELSFTVHSKYTRKVPSPAPFYRRQNLMALPLTRHGA